MYILKYALDMTIMVLEIVAVTFVVSGVVLALSVGIVTTCWPKDK